MTHWGAEKYFMDKYGIVPIIGMTLKYLPSTITCA
jgi:hypothetical protein